MKENVQRRKEIEEKVIQCTEEFDRQHSNLTTSPQPADNQEKPTPISSEEELTVEKSEQFIETRVTTANLHENTSHSLLLTQSQLKDLLRLFFTVFFAILCGNILPDSLDQLF